MNLKCVIGLHEWAGCTCGKCGRTRDQGHDWSKDCETCAKCGATRQSDPQWSGCKCSACGRTRNCSDEDIHSACEEAIDELLPLLKSAYISCCSGFTFENAPQRDAIRAIGYRLHALNGKDAMLAVGEPIRRMDYKLGMVLEHMWDRIGRWLA